MEFQIYFSFKSFEEFYLKDYKYVEKENSSSLIDYYNFLLESYYKLERDFSFDYEEKKESNFNLLSKSLRNDDFFSRDFWVLFETKYREYIKIIKNGYKRDFLKNNISEVSWIIGLEFGQIVRFLENEIIKLENTINVSKKTKTKLSNPKKLALLNELGIFDLPKMKNLSDDRQNDIIGLLLDADKTEFVYKNRLNINSKDPNYQIEKYGAYKYLDEMKKLISDI